MSTCKHCGGPARPRTGTRGFAPMTCEGCRRMAARVRVRHWRLAQMAEDPQGFRAYNAQYLRDWRAKRRAEGAPA
jgi:hypothetical protein